MGTTLSITLGSWACLLAPSVHVISLGCLSESRHDFGLVSNFSRKVRCLPKIYRAHPNSIYQFYVCNYRSTAKGSGNLVRAETYLWGSFDLCLSSVLHFVHIWWTRRLLLFEMIIRLLIHYLDLRVVSHRGGRIGANAVWNTALLDLSSLHFLGTRGFWALANDWLSKLRPIVFILCKFLCFCPENFLARLVVLLAHGSFHTTIGVQRGPWLNLMKWLFYLLDLRSLPPKGI